MKSIVTLIITAIIAALAIVYAYPSATYRYRLTLVAEADGQDVVASSVVQITRGVRIAWMSNSPGFFDTIVGEALAVELGSRGTMFALLQGSGPRCSLPQWVAPVAFGVKTSADTRTDLSGLLNMRGERKLPFKCLPLLVRFKDIADPLTIERVDPYDLAAHFGNGTRLVDATIEITTDAITSGIDERLPWLGRVGDGNLKSQGMEVDFLSSVRGAYFKRRSLLF